ncbi:hypothetical protein AB0M46_15365 [Dactylosporangium sp. NPDC051485]|uniref:hypothetical protein n=1 Tax=Dactylosporangium sp. NPDC051485 TaxID=3154846 RepID=UPI00341748E7
MDLSPLLLAGGACLGVLLVFAIVVGVVQHRRERRRREGLQQWAAHNGWRYEPRPAVDWWRRLPGRNRRGVTLALTGLVGGRTVSIAEYSHTTTTTTPGPDGVGTTSPSTHRYVVYLVRLRQALPGLAVHRRGAVSRFGRALFGDRPTALGHEPFDRAYRISAERPDVVPAVFRRDLVAEHVAGRLPEWSLHGAELMTFETGRIDDPATIPGRFAALVRLADLIEPR